MFSAFLLQGNRSRGNLQVDRRSGRELELLPRVKVKMEEI